MVDDQNDFTKKLSVAFTNYAFEVEKNPEISADQFLIDSGLVNDFMDSFPNIDDATKALITTSFDIYARTNCDQQTKIIIKNNLIRMIKESIQKDKGMEFSLKNS